MKKLRQIVNEVTAADIGLKKGKIQQVSPAAAKKAAKELFDLIQHAYKPIGGHAKLKSPADLAQYDYWELGDIDDDPEIDVVSFGSKKPAGTKMGGMGHDGEKSNIKQLLKTSTGRLKTPYYFVEVSGKPFEIYVLRGGVDIVEDEELVKKILKKPITWYGKHPKSGIPGNGWYSRAIGGTSHVKTLVGYPKGK